MKKKYKKNLFIFICISLLIFFVGLFTHKINYGEMTVTDKDTDVYSSYSNKEVFVDENDAIEQDLDNTKGILNSFSLKYHIDQFNSNLLLNINLIEKNTGEVLGTWIEDGSNIHEDGFAEYKVASNTKSKKLAIIIKSNMATNVLCFSEIDSIKQCDLLINNDVQSGDLILRETSNIFETATVYWGLLYSCIIGCVFTFFITSYKKVIEFLKTKIRCCWENRFIFLREFLIVIFCIISALLIEHLYTLYHLHVGHNISQFNKYKCRFFFGIIFVLVTLILDRKKITKAPEKYFLLLFSVIGVIFVISMPAQAEVSWDESIHYWNAISIADAWKGCANSAESYLYWHSGIGGYGIPTMISDLNEKHNAVQSLFNQGGKETINISLLSALNALAYLPSAIGINIGKFLHFSMKNTFYIGALMNMFLYLALGYFSIKKLKSGKMILMTIITVPTAFFLSSVYSYDSWVTGFTMLGISYLVGILQNKEETVTIKEMLVMLGAFALGFLAKAIYFPLFLLYLLIPENRFESNKECTSFRIAAISFGMTYLLEMVLPAKYLLFLIIFTYIFNSILYKLYKKIPENKRKLTLLLVLIIGFACFTVAIYVFLPKLVGTGDTRGGNDVNSAAQVAFVLNNPMQYLRILMTYLLGNYLNPLMALKVIFGTFGYLGESSLTYLSMLFFVLILFLDKNEYDFWKNYNIFKVSSIVISFVTIVLIATALYVSFTPVGFYAINGCQPRYLIPLLSCIGLSIGSIKMKKRIHKEYVILMTFSFCSLMLLFDLWKIVICGYM